MTDLRNLPQYFQVGSPPALITQFDSGQVVQDREDFGIAQPAGMEQTRTRTGAIRGSLPCTSPEQANEEPLDARSELFSVALVLRELLTGRRVFAQSHEAALLRAMLFEPISPLGDDRPDLPPEVLAVFGSALSRTRDERPSGAGALSRALEEAAPGLAWAPAAIADWLRAKGPGPLFPSPELRSGTRPPPRRRRTSAIEGQRSGVGESGGSTPPAQDEARGSRQS